MQNNSPKRVRYDDETTNTAQSALTSTCKSIWPLAKKRAEKVLSMHKAVLKAKAIVQHLEDPSYLPKSIKHGLTITFSEPTQRLKQTEMDAINTKLEAEKAKYYEKAKSLLLEAKKLEHSVSFTERTKELCISLAYVAQLFFTRYNKETTDPNSQELLANDIADELIYLLIDTKPFLLSPFGFSNAELKTFYEHYVTINNRGTDPHNGNFQKRDTETEAEHHTRIQTTVALRYDDPAARFEHFSLLIKGLFYDPVIEINAQRSNDARISATRKYASLYMKEMATVETAIAMNVEAPAPDPNLSKVQEQQELHKKEIKALKQTIQRLTNPSTPRKGKNGKGSANQGAGRPNNNTDDASETSKKPKKKRNGKKKANDQVDAKNNDGDKEKKGKQSKKKNGKQESENGKKTKSKKK